MNEENKALAGRTWWRGDKRAEWRGEDVGDLYQCHMRALLACVSRSVAYVIPFLGNRHALADRCIPRNVPQAPPGSTFCPPPCSSLLIYAHSEPDFSQDRLDAGGDCLLL